MRSCLSTHLPGCSPLSRAGGRPGIEQMKMWNAKDKQRVAAVPLNELTFGRRPLQSSLAATESAAREV
jgi:hypothetical protein